MTFRGAKRTKGMDFGRWGGVGKGVMVMFGFERRSGCGDVSVCCLVVSTWFEEI